jgi:hypothetical protein
MWVGVGLLAGELVLLAASTVLIAIPVRSASTSQTA